MDKTVVEPVVERRMLLRGAGVAGASLVGVAAASGPASAQGRGDHRDSGLLGAWLVTHTDDPPDSNTGHAVVGFSVGGVFSEVEIAPVQAPGLGAWDSRGDRFQATFWTGGSDDSGPTPQEFTVRVKLRGKRHHDHIEARYRGTVFDAHTGKELSRFTGKATGDRIEA